MKCLLCGQTNCAHTLTERNSAVIRSAFEARAAQIECGETRTLPRLSKQLRYVDIEISRVDRAADAPEQDIYEISFSSEAKIPRWWGVEVLSHEKSAIDMRYIKRNGALLVEHEGEVVGVVIESWLDEPTRKLRGKIKFSRSKRGKEVEQDVIDGIRTRLSVGYVIVKAKLVVQGESMADDEWLITRWMPVEVSLVGIPADLSVGVGRSAETGETFAVEIEGGASAEEERTMKCKVCQLESCNHTAEERAGTAQPVETRTSTAAPGTNPAAPAAVTVARGENGPATATIEGGESLRRDVAAIAKLCQHHGVSSRIAEFVERRLTLDQVKGEILEARTTSPLRQPGSERVVELSEREARQFSYRELIHARASGVALEGVYKEVDTDIRGRLPTGVRTNGGVFVPTRLRAETQEEIDRRELARERRTMSGVTPGAGPELVGVERGEFIDLLRNRTILAQMGATIISDLAGNYEVVRQNAGAAATWVGEAPASPVGDSQGRFEIIGAVPKTLMGNTPYTRQLLVQTSGAVEQKVRDDLAKGHGLAFDLAGLYGKGTKYTPQGVYATPGVTVATMGGQPDWTKLTAMYGAIAAKNALMGALGFVTHPTLAALLMAKPKVAGAAAGFCWEGSILDGQVAGFKASSTAQISLTHSGLADTGGTEIGGVAGNWNDLDFLSWAAMELLVDLYSQKKSGIIEVTSFQMVDILVEHPESFVVTSGMTL